MLGRILEGLTDPTTAETVLAVVGGPDIRSRIEQAAATGDSPVGELIAGKVRHLLDHGGEDVWLDLVATMSDTLQPGTAAVDRILARAFPDPVRVQDHENRAMNAIAPAFGSARAARDKPILADTMEEAQALPQLGI